MTAEEVSKFIQNYILKAMQTIEQSRLNGHLVYATDLFNQCSDMQECINKFKTLPKELNSRFTTSPFLDIKISETRWGETVYFSRFYQLKKSANASAALDDILNNSTTVIDCVEAINIAWYMCIQALLIHCYGEADGKTKFNQLFCEDNRTFIISDYDMYGIVGAAYDCSYFASVPILSYFVEHLRNDKIEFSSANEDPLIKPAVRINIFNDPRYGEKHPIGEDICINIMCVGKDQYLGLGLGINPLSETQVIEFLKKSFEQKPIEERLPWLKQVADWKKFNKVLNEVAPALVPKSGYKSSHSTQLNINILVLLTRDFSKALKDINNFVLEYQFAQLVAFRQNFTRHNRQRTDIGNIKVLEETIQLTNHILTKLTDKDKLTFYAKNLAMAKKNLANLLGYHGDFAEGIKQYIEAKAGLIKLNESSLALECEIEIQRFQKFIEDKKNTNSRVETAPKVERQKQSTPRRDLLSQITQCNFNYDDNQRKFWMLTKSEQEAKKIVEKLNNSKSGFIVSSGKIAKSEKYPEDRYRVVVGEFDAATISSNLNRK